MLLQQDGKAFDFNIQFEELFFVILPSALFIVASFWRTLSQARKPKLVHAPTFQYIKLVSVTYCLSLSTVLIIRVGCHNSLRLPSTRHRRSDSSQSCASL
jgi:hypothetical protein